MKRVTLIVSTMKSLVPWVSGFLSNRDFEAGSVARVRAVKVRMDSFPVRGDGGYEGNDGSDVC